MTTRKYPNLRVLVVDDDALTSQLVKAVLENLGVSTVDHAADGAKAMSMVKAAPEPYGLIICDWMMPVMTGLEFLEKFRAADKTTPFVMLTAKTETQEFNKAKSMGADYFLMKPLDVDGLQLRLGTIVSKAAQL